MKRENFYRRDPSKALSGMIGLSLEERGVYNTVLDLLYSTWRPLEDDRGFIAGWCGCAVQKLNPIIRRLVDKGRLITFQDNGRTYLSDEAFEVERSAVKGPTPSRSGRGQVGEKSGEVGEKSAGVEENPPTCDDETEQNQPVTALEKTREDKSRYSEANASEAGASEGDPDEDEIADLRLMPRLKGAWRLAVKLLMVRAKMPEPRARALVGKWAKQLGEPDPLWEIAEKAWDIGTLAPESYVAAAIERRLTVGTGVVAPPERQQRVWMQDFLESPNSWRPFDRGPRPGEPGCRIAIEIQREFGVEPMLQEHAA